MKMFIIQSCSQLTDSYHSGGGIAIIASDIDDAKKLVFGVDCIEISDDEWKSAEVFELADKNTPTNFWIFPNAGCC